MNFDKYGGRRYIFAWAGLVFSFILCITDCMNGGEFVAALGLLSGIYTAANTTQKLKGANNDSSN